MGFSQSHQPIALLVIEPFFINNCKIYVGCELNLHEPRIGGLAAKLILNNSKNRTVTTNRNILKIL